MNRIIAGLLLVVVGVLGFGLGVFISGDVGRGVFIAGTVLFLLGLGSFVWGLIARASQKEAEAWAGVRSRFPFLQPTKKTIKTVMGRMAFDYGLSPSTLSGLDYRPIDPLGTSMGFHTSIVLQGNHDGLEVQMGKKFCGSGQSAVATLWIHIHVAEGLPYKLGVWTDRPDYEEGRVPVPAQFSNTTVRATNVQAATALFDDGLLLQQLCAVENSTFGAPTTLFWQHGDGFFECNLTTKGPVYERALGFALAFAARASSAGAKTR